MAAGASLPMPSLTLARHFEHTTRTAQFPHVVVLEVSFRDGESSKHTTKGIESVACGGSFDDAATGNSGDALTKDGTVPRIEVEEMLLLGTIAARIPYVVSALSDEWRSNCTETDAQVEHLAAAPRVQVFLPHGCLPAVLRALISRLSVDASERAHARDGLLTARWRPTDPVGALRLVQVASMLQMDDLLPELAELVRDAVSSTGDVASLEAACRDLELPAAVREVAAATARLDPPEPQGLPDEAQVQGMIASALLTADGKVWRVVQKVIDRREAWPRLARENASLLLAFATGLHGSIRATPHTGFFWGSRDFLYLVCRYVRAQPEHLDAMVSAMFDSVYNMDPELPAEIIDAVFKELLVHEGLSFAQCEHVIAKLMQREDQLEYLFHEWSGVFPTLPGNARRALAKGLLPAVGRCPHVALDFVLEELEMSPKPSGAGVGLVAIRRLLQRCLRLNVPAVFPAGSVLLGVVAGLMAWRW